MISPITNKSNNVIELFKIDSELIINLYKNDYGIDVKRFFNSKSISLYQCNESKLRFFYPHLLSGDERLYKDLQQISGDGYYPKWKWEYKAAMDFIGHNDKVLDVGCGNGHFLDYLNIKQIEGEGIELNENAIENCLSKGLRVYGEDLYEFGVGRSSNFDIVCSFQVLEHIIDIDYFIKSSIDLIKKGGKLILATPNNNPYLYRFDKYHTLNLPPHHMSLWSAEVFEKLPEYYPVKLISIRKQPLEKFDYWFKIQVLHYTGNKIFGLKSLMETRIIRNLLRVFGFFFKNLIHGKTIVVVYERV